MQQCIICNKSFNRRKTESKKNYSNRRYCSNLCSNSVNKTKHIDLVGRVFGKLTVEYLVGSNNELLWHCRCSCGGANIVTTNRLSSGTTKSCGCLISDSLRERRTTHGMSKTRIYYLWNAIGQRCNNKNCDKYEYYGGRGITVCKEWRKFNNFFEDMGNSYNDHVLEYGEKNTSIDRIDNNKGYSKDNCRWATIIEQANNKRNKTLLTEKTSFLEFA